ncbi:MAG: DUF2244 domain-containing protein [Pseudomonadota bacterium]
MIEIQSNDTQHVLILEPNKSMSWQTNKKILLFMLFVNMLIGISFALVGAWMILPFAGLEIAAVAAGTYYVCWKLNFKEIITIEAESVILQKGVYYPKQTWHWQKSATRLLSRPGGYRQSPPDLYLKHLDETVEIGDFLNRKEKIRLRNGLNKVGIIVR